jgi:hypothetical protein
MEVGGFPTGTEFRTKYAGEDIAFRNPLRTWGKVQRIDGVFLEYTIYPGGHFDRYMDAICKGSADPTAADIQAAALGARAEWVRRRMTGQGHQP